MKTVKSYFAILFFFAFISNAISQDNEKSFNLSFEYKTVKTSDYVYGEDFKVTKHLINIDTTSNLNVIDGAYKAFAVGNIPAVLAVMDSSIIWNEAEGNSYADGNPYIGPDAVLNGIFVRIGADHEYFHLVDIKLHEMSNDQVLATLRYKGKLKKNGAIYNTQAAHLWTLKDGKVTNFQQYVDTKQLAEAFGK